MKTLSTRRKQYKGTIIITLITILFAGQLAIFIYKPWVMTHNSRGGEQGRGGKGERIYEPNNLISRFALIMIISSRVYTPTSMRGRYRYSRVIIILSMLIVFLHYQIEAPTYLG